MQPTILSLHSHDALGIRSTRLEDCIPITLCVDISEPRMSNWVRLVDRKVLPRRSILQLERWPIRVFVGADLLKVPHHRPGLIPLLTAAMIRPSTKTPQGLIFGSLLTSQKTQLFGSSRSCSSKSFAIPSALSRNERLHISWHQVHLSCLSFALGSVAILRRTKLESTPVAKSIIEIEYRSFQAMNLSHRSQILKGRSVFRRVLCILLASIIILQPSTALAWSEGAHHVIGVNAFDTMTPAAQKRLLEILRAHPRFGEDFKTDLREPKAHGHFMLGTAAYWPDTARDLPQFHRSTWHYQLGAALVIGNPPKVPANPGALPAGANLATQDLHIEQAIELCRKTLRGSAPDSDKAIAICWLAHLVGDAHQPCHAGSLYAEGVFPGPTGDRGANSIPTKQRRNLHALWDGLMGTSAKPNEIARRVFDVRQNKLAIQEAEAVGSDLRTSHWLFESVEASRKYVYTRTF